MMKKSNLYFLLITSQLAVLSTSVLSDDKNPTDATDRVNRKYDFKPILLDSENTDSSTLGIQYNFSDSLFNKNYDTEDAPDCSIFPCPKTVVGSAKVTYDLKGTFTENADNNPKNFIETNINGSYFKASMDSTLIWSGGIFLKYETDQKFNNKQLVYGLNGAISNRNIFHNKDFAFVQISLGTIDPSEDIARENIIGNSIDSYERVDFELIYKFIINKGLLDTFEVNYRYFKELSPDPEIKKASLDDFRLITYRLGLTNNMYIAYSSGELPFNQKDNQIYEVGYTYNFD